LEKKEHLLVSGVMNKEHLDFCASEEWAQILQDHILPWALGDRDLGDDVLEVGAGPGLSTDVLRRRVPRLTAVELDEELAAKLADRLASTNVEVVKADATALPLESDRFSAATCFTMLHHVPTSDMQDRLLAELCRVLRPGGLLIGSDSVASDDLREFHAGDVYLPIDPGEIPARLEAAGFDDITVELGGDENETFRFSATASA
jgi:ubiquinone/menaquinone biosynthesis C-methylase UbiE